MSNIRGLNDYRPDEGQQQPERPSRAQKYQIQQFEIEDSPTSHQPSAQEPAPVSRVKKCAMNCWMLFFPNFKLRSITFIYASILIFVFIITEIVYGANQQTLTWVCTLYYSGAKFTYAISRKGHVHRLLLPIILHSGWFHLFWNIMSLLMLGFSVEKALNNWKKYVSLIVLGGIGANIISAVLDPYSIAVGASTSLFAMIGCVIVWCYINWQKMGPMRMQYVIFLGVILGFALLDGFLMRNTGIDSYGHLGGLIYGVILGLLMLISGENQNTKYQPGEIRKIKNGCVLALSMLTVSFFVAIFAMQLPWCDQNDCDNIC